MFTISRTKTVRGEGTRQESKVDRHMDKRVITRGKNTVKEST